MINNYYSLYINNCLTLAKTIVIKSIESVEGLNKYVNDYSGIYGVDKVDTINPLTWKYYLNISGEYHSIDTMMNVTSLDTLEVIDFTKENLKLHTATAAAYLFGTDLYNQLVKQYPLQEMLIKGILNPVNINDAINAKDGTILGYPKYLVEENEYSLINKLQSWIYGYKVRWVNQQYGISDVLYPATSLGIMYVNLVPAILNFRLEACKTNEAHSFHVRQYLASHGLLTEYIDYMTLKQALFFYRNICYINLNSGKKHIFSWLIENVLTERNLPIAEYIMRHELSNILNDIYPEIAFYNNPLNSKYNTSTVNSKYDLLEVMMREDILAKDNPIYRPDYLPVIKEKMENSLSNELRTKTLESSVIDGSDSDPWSLGDVLFNHWLFLSTNGNYVAHISVTNPRNNETISLSVRDAFVLAWYVFCKSINIDPVTVPEVLAARVQRIVPITNIVTVDEIMSVVDPVLINKNIGIQALSMQPKINTVISTTAFYNLCTKIHDATQMQRMLIASQELSSNRAMVFNMVDRIYSDNMCNLTDIANQTYGQWFSAQNLNLGNLSINELNILYSDLVKQCTGLTSTATNTLSNIQDAMLRLLSKLSSYSIQFIKTINTSRLEKTDWTAVRGDNLECSSSYVYNTNNTGVDVSNISTKFYSDYNHVLVEDRNFVKNKQRSSYSYNLNLKSLLYLNSVMSVREMRVNFLGIRAKYNEQSVSNPLKILPVLGIETYLSLTVSQQESLKDIYNKYSFIQ